MEKISPVDGEALFNASMILTLHSKSTDGFYKDICKICEALIKANYDIEDINNSIKQGKVDA